MAEILEVSRRVIFNDREFMINRLGAPIEYDREHSGWYYSDRTWILPGMIVTEGELLAFFLSMEISKRFLGSSLETPLRSAVEKITRAVKGPISVDVEALRSFYTFAGPVLLAANEQALLDIHHAITSRRCLWMRYFTAGRGEYTERKVMPYHLHNFNGDWFLVAFDTLRNRFRTFLVGRIAEWKLLPETFQPDEDFSAAEWMGNAFQVFGDGEAVQVSIRFSPLKAQFIRERRWHPSQRIEENPDGSLVLHLKTASLVEVKYWALSFGSDAEVLAPESLRQDCLVEIDNLKKVYQNHSKESVS